MVVLYLAVNGLDPLVWRVDWGISWRLGVLARSTQFCVHCRYALDLVSYFSCLFVGTAIGAFEKTQRLQHHLVKKLGMNLSD